MTVKILVIMITGILAGLAFMGVGFYFLSSTFLNKLNEASPVKEEKQQNHNAFRAKGSGYVSIALGALTLMWSILLAVCPPLLNLLVLIYMIFLVAAFAVLTVVFR